MCIRDRDYKDLQLFRQNFERTLSMIGEMRIEALASEEMCIRDRVRSPDRRKTI